MPTGLYAKAVQRPLGPIQLQKKITPSCIVVHTMAGYLGGTDKMFHNNGYHGDFSHFGIGGEWDGINDGVVYQWQNMNYVANAQYSGNAYAISIETSDGARSDVAWSPRQLDALVSLIASISQDYGIPAKKMTVCTDRGVGYHSQFKAEWNRDGHTCPGAVRIEQLFTTVLPRVNSILSPTFSTKDDVMDVVRDATTLRCYLRTSGGKLIYIPDGPDLETEQKKFGTAQNYQSIYLANYEGYVK